MILSTQTRLGNQLRVAGGFVNGQPPTDPQLLLEANLGELSRQLDRRTAPGGYTPEELGEAGSWVFMVDISTTWPAIPPANFAVNPLKLRIMMGSGGTNHTLEFDAVGGATVQVPTSVVRVEVFWDRLPTVLDGAGNPVDYFRIPSEVIVRGTLQRANVVPNARRSFLCNLRAAGVGFQTTRGSIPPYSYDWMVYGPQAAAIYAGLSDVQMQGPIGLSTVHEMTAVQMLAALTAGYRFPVPPVAESWEVNIDLAVGGLDITIIDFGVGT